MAKATTKGGPATPAQIALHGQFAGRLRAFMKERGMSIGDLNEALGQPREHTNVYQWLNAKGGPGPENRQKLAALMNGANATSAAPRAAAHTVAPRIASFEMLSDGTARIAVTLVLPIPDASALWLEITKRLTKQ